jgi:hypothetical protein
VRLGGVCLLPSTPSTTPPSASACQQPPRAREASAAARAQSEVDGPCCAKVSRLVAGACFGELGAGPAIAGRLEASDKSLACKLVAPSRPDGSAGPTNSPFGRCLDEDDDDYEKSSAATAAKHVARRSPGVGPAAGWLCRGREGSMHVGLTRTATIRERAWKLCLARQMSARGRRWLDESQASQVCGFLALLHSDRAL